MSMFEIIYSLVNIVGFIAFIVVLGLVIVRTNKDDKAKADSNKEWKDFVIKNQKDNEEYVAKHKEFIEKFNAQTPVILANSQKEWERQQANSVAKTLSNKDAEATVVKLEKLCDDINKSIDSLLATCGEINKNK